MSCQINSHNCGKAGDFISRLKLTPVPLAKCGQGNRVRTWKGQEEVGIPDHALSGKTVQFPYFSLRVKSAVILL